jgi:hypothetical protein
MAKLMKVRNNSSSNCSSNCIAAPEQRQQGNETADAMQQRSTLHYEYGRQQAHPAYVKQAQ